MQEYEKKLHLDKRWETMKAMSGGLKFFYVGVHAVTYAVMFIGLKWLMTWVPDIKPFQGAAKWFELIGIPFTKVDGIYFILGWVTYLYGSVRLAKISEQNHSVRGKDDRPNRLLMEGCYAELRHPMYGTFVLHYAAVLLALRSLIGVVLVILFTVSQYINASLEEKRKLIPAFNEAYKVYMTKVPHRLLKKWELIGLILALAVSVVGLWV